VSTELANTDNQIQSLINAALEIILEDDAFTTQFSLSVINSVSQQTVDGATNYRFDVNFKNTNGQVITATFEATYTYSTASQSIANLAYQVHTYTVAETVTQTFTTLTQEFIQSSPLIQSIVDFGVHEVLNYALKAEQIQNTHFQISNINSVATQAYDSAVFYNCSVHLTNADGLLLSTYFTVFNHASLSLSIIVDYSFAVIDNQETIGEINDIIQLIAPNETEYTAISTEVVQNDAIVQEALYTGAEQVVQIGLNQNTLSVADFTVSEITQAWSQIIGNGLYYKFSVVLSNSAGQTITTTFEVYYQIYIDETRFVSYTFSLDGSTTQDLIYVVPILTLDGSYIKCSESEIRTSLDLFNALDFGANTVAQRGYDAGNIPAGQYYLFQVESAEKFNFTLGLAYRFKIGFTNKNGVLVQTNFTTLVLATQYSLSGYSYQANLNGYGCSSTGITDSGAVIDVDCTITSSVIIGSKDQNNTNPTNPGTNNTNPVPSPGSDYYLLTAEEIQDPIVQSCIIFGQNSIVQIGVQIGSFSFSKWTLHEVIAVYQKNQNWGTTYKITLQLLNAKGLKLETTFTLSYNFVTLLIRLNSYKYNVGGFIRTRTVATTSNLPVVVPTPPSNTSNLPFSESNDNLPYASNGYYQIPLHWVDLSEDIQNCITFGANAVVQIGVKQDKIPVSDYIIYNIIRVQRFVGARGSYYAIRIYLTNVNNVNLVTTFTCYIVKATKEISLYSYAYTASNILTQWFTPGGNETTATPSNVTTVTNSTSLVISASWDTLTVAELQENLEAQQALKFGAEYVTNVSIQSNSAPAGAYAISTIKSVSRKSSIRGVFYLCSVVLTSTTNVKITTNYTVYIDKSTQIPGYSISSYQYQVSNDQDTVSQQPDETTGYIAINITDILGNTQISAYINFGINQVLQNSETYTISAVNSAYTQVINGAYYYKFNVTLTSQDVTVQLNFIFYYKPATGEQVVTAYSINTIINATETPALPDQTYTEEDSTNTDFNTVIESGSQIIIQQLFNSNVIASTDFTVSQVTKVLSSKVETSVYYQFELTLKNAAGVSLNLTLNVKQGGSASNVELVSYLVLGTSTDQTDALVSSSQTTSTQTSSSVQVSSTQIQTDAEIQAAINYGAQEVITQISQNLNVSTDFKITETTSVYQEIVSSSSYTVKVTLTNSEGRKADAHYSVNYQSSTNVKQVISSKYVVY